MYPSEVLFFLRILASVRELEKPFVTFPEERVHLLLVNIEGSHLHLRPLLHAERDGLAGAGQFRRGQLLTGSPLAVFRRTRG